MNTGVSFKPLCLIVWQEREIVSGHCISTRKNASEFAVGSIELKGMGAHHSGFSCQIKQNSFQYSVRR